MGNVCPCPKRNKKKDFAYDPLRAHAKEHAAGK